MGTFKKEISQHTQKQFMGKIYTQWSEIIIHPSVGKTRYPSPFSFKEGNFGQRKSSNIFSAKKVCDAHNIIATPHQQMLEPFFSR